MLVAWLLLATPGNAQRLTGEIRLQVRDSSLAEMPAEGSLESLAAAVHRTYRTDSHGTHIFSALPFGVYRLEVGHRGFVTRTLRIDVHSETPLEQTVTLAVAGLETEVVVREAETLLDPASTTSAQHLGPDALNHRASSAPGRSVIDLVNRQPGWLLEANGVLHPRGSEYGVQYVADGIPLYDNRSPAFAQSLGIDEFESMTVRAGGYPAEFGRRLGGVIEINTERDARPGVHGRAGFQHSGYNATSGFASLQFARGGNSFGVSGEGMSTDRYLDAPVTGNYTNHGSGGGLSGRIDRQWASGDATRLYFHSRRTGFQVPNELLQQMAGQRQDRASAETLGQVSHTHLFSAHAVGQARVMVRDTSARLWGNALSIPILPSQDRGFRETYAGASIAWNRGAHEIKAGGDALFSGIHENFAYRITARRIGTVRIFDGDVPLAFAFSAARHGRDQSAFVQDLWRKGKLTLSAGLRFDHYRLVADETAWSPRLAAGYSVPSAGLVLRASFDRVFQTPAVENVLLASTDLVSRLGGEGAFLPLKPARGNFFEAGFAKSIFGKMRLDGAWFLRRTSNFGDDSLLFNTGVSFPIAFQSGDVHGYEARLDLPSWRRVSASLSYSNMVATGQLPVAGGLLLGDEAAELLSGRGSFPITQDQRNSFRSRVRLELSKRSWVAFGAGYNSGLPFEIEGPANMAFMQQQYGEAILSKVNFENGRVRPSASLDASAGIDLRKSEHRSLRLQGDVSNLGGRLNVINFAGVLSGTALEAGRTFSLRLSGTF